MWRSSQASLLLRPLSPEGQKEPKEPKWTETGLDRPKTASSSLDIASEFTPLQAISKNTPLRCERVNEVTYKITAGDYTNAKAAAIAMSAGACGDYTVERPIAQLNGLQARSEDAS